MQKKNASLEHKENKQVRYYAIFFCLAITLHNIEEAIWLPQWSQLGHPLQQPVTANEFYFAVIIITALAYFISFLFVHFPGIKIIKWAFIGFLGSMIFNAFFPHLISMILMKKYAPGFITGLLLNVPINSFILYKLHTQHLISAKNIIISTVIVGALLLMLIPFLFNMASMLVSY